MAQGGGGGKKVNASMRNRIEGLQRWFSRTVCTMNVQGPEFGLSIRKGSQVWHYMPVIPPLGSKDREILVVCWPPSLAKLVYFRFSERLCLKKEKRWRGNNKVIEK